ncbi:DsbA family protein [bacterium]|nr:DsbA family protein [bacterium]
MKLIGNKMKFFNKKRNFSTRIFVTVSLLGTFFLFAILFILSSYFYYSSTSSEAEDNYSHNYYDYHDPTDPFITKNLNLREKITKPIISEKDPILGESDASITIVQFSDFECKVCSGEEKKIRDLLNDEKYGSKIRLVWKDFPMTDTGSVSWKASLAARCAQEQNRFWDYHDLLYGDNGELDRGLYIDLARELSLDLDDFLSCYDNEVPEELFKNNIIEATDLGLPGIPYFYINDQEFLGEIKEENLKKLIDTEKDY